MRSLRRVFGGVEASPLTICPGGILGWWDASDDGPTAGIVQDLSGNGNDLIRTTGTQGIITLDGFDAVRIASSRQNIATHGTKKGTMAVIKLTTPELGAGNKNRTLLLSNNRGFFLEDGSNILIKNNSTTLLDTGVVYDINGPYISIGYAQGALLSSDVHVYINGVNVGISGTAITTTSTTIGSNSSFHWASAAIPEMFSFDCVQDDATMLAFHNYLAEKGYFV